MGYGFYVHDIQARQSVKAVTVLHKVEMLLFFWRSNTYASRATLKKHFTVSGHSHLRWFVAVKWSSFLYSMSLTFFIDITVHYHQYNVRKTDLVRRFIQYSNKRHFHLSSELQQRLTHPPLIYLFSKYICWLWLSSVWTTSSNLTLFSNWNYLILWASDTAAGCIEVQIIIEANISFFYFSRFFIVLWWMFLFNQEQWKKSEIQHVSDLVFPNFSR